MRLILINFVLVFAIISYELTPVCLGNNTLEYTWSRKNVTRKLKDMNLIQLIDFQQPILMAQNVIDNNKGTLVCKNFKTIQNIKPKIYKGVGNMQCHGWIDSCQSIRDDITRKRPAIYCYSDHYKRLTWIRDKNLKKYGYDTGRCRKIKLQPNKTTISKNNYIKNACLCKCTEGSNNPELNTTNWAFSLQPQISDIDNNRIVTGIRIAKHGKIIYLEIKESRIGSYEDNSWKPVDSQNKLIRRDVDYSFLEPDNRSINLDKILLPADYVVTGVKFKKTPNRYAKGQNWTLRLEVQGTKFDSVTRKLIKGTSVWFDSETSVESPMYYGQNRSEISVEHSSPLSPVNEDDRLYKPNRYIKFTTTKLQQDLGRFTIPYLSTSPVQSGANKFLKGIGLLYKGRKGYAGYIVPRIYTAERKNRSKKYVTEIFIAKGNRRRSFKNEDVKNAANLRKHRMKPRISTDKKIVESLVQANTQEKKIMGKEYMIDKNRLRLTYEKNDENREKILADESMKERDQTE